MATMRTGSPFLRSLLLVLLFLLLGALHIDAFLLPRPGAGRTKACGKATPAASGRVGSILNSRLGSRLVVASAKDPEPPPSWPPQGFRPFKSLREDGSNLVEFSLEPHRDSLLDAPPSQFFAGFRLREFDESDDQSGERLVGISFRGFLWFVALLWPYMAFGLLCSSAAQFLVDQARNGNGAPLDVIDFPDLKSIHGFVGTILGFTISIRTSSAYDRYYEGRKILSSILENSRAIIRDVYSFVLKPPATAPPTASDDAAVVAISDDVRRRLDVLFAFIRQSVRESFLGFDSDSEFRNLPFTNGTFFLDPCMPQLADMLNLEEAQRYAAIPPRSRPGAVAAEINIILQILGNRLQYADAFLGKTQSHLSRITEAQSTMLRIRDTPVPLPYIIILNIATWLFVYSTPFLYRTGIEGRFIGIQFLVLAYFGILSIGRSIENPFAYDAFDIDFEEFGQQLARDTATTADALREDRAAFLKELVHPEPEEEKGSAGSDGS